MNFGIHDMLSALNTLSSSVAGMANSVSFTSLDYSLITNSIVVIGEFPDDKAEEVLSLTQGKAVMMWNLSPRPTSNTVRLLFENQVVDVAWKTPCQYTRAPRLDTVFSLCLSMKAWYDLSPENLCFLSNPVGRANAGIVVACFLRYIGAFDRTAHAYDHYRHIRGKDNATAGRLAPSYNQLFANIDKTVESNGYSNTTPLHLKIITIQGLPVEELPCIEVWDLNGLIFSSHSGRVVDSSCFWDADSGDAFFKVAHYIIGDFSIVCSFRGGSSDEKSKSAIIFKYQNSTAFLGEEILKLRMSEVDFNPEHSDKLHSDGDPEAFALNLVFDRELTPSNQISRANAVTSLPSFPKYGIEAFEAGLDEISKSHPVVPDSKLYSELNKSSSEDRYISVALQLANNDVSVASSLIEKMKKRASDFIARVSPVDTTIDITTDMPASLSYSEDSWEVINLRCPVCKDESAAKKDQIISCSECSRIFHTFCVGLRKIPYSSSNEQDQQYRDKYIRRHFCDWKCPDCKIKLDEVGASSGCEVRQGVLSPPRSEFRGKTVAATMCQPTSRQSYSTSTGSGIVVTDQARPLTNATGQPMPAWAGSPSTGVPTVVSGRSSTIESTTSPEMFKSKQDQTALLSVWLSEAGVSLESLRNLPEEEMREKVLSVIAARNPDIPINILADNRHGNLDLGTALKGLLQPLRLEGLIPAINGKVGGDSPVPSLNMGTKTELFPTISSPSRYFGKSLTSETVPATKAVEDMRSEDERKASFDPRANMLKLIQSRTSIQKAGVTVAAATSKATSQNDHENLNEGNGVFVTGGVLPKGFPSTNVSDLPQLEKYYKLMKAGIPKEVVAQKMVNEKAVGSTDIAEYLVNVNPLDILPEDFYQRFNAQVPVSSHPKYEKFFKMLTVGIAKEAVKEKMRLEGVDPTKLDLDPNQAISYMETETNTAASPDGEALVALHMHPKYSKFFKMLKVGLPKDAVKMKMQQEGADPTMLDKDPSEKIPVKDQPASSVPDASQEMVAVSEHPKYSKFFKMLKVGLPKDAVKMKMQQEGADPTMLDKDPSEKIPVKDQPASSVPDASQEMVAVSEHPKYSKFFKMLKMGLPKGAVQLKMQQEGADPTMLDKDPSEKIPVKDQPASSVPDASQEMVAVSEHPKYSKFFKMLKMGLPKGAVQLKMQQEGADPTMLDKDPSEKIPVNENEAKVNEGPKVPAGEHPAYSKYFKMLKVGLPLEAVKAKAQLEGLDPSVLEKDASELIPVNPSPQSNGSKALKKVEPIKVRKKKLYLKALDASKVSQNSIWADEMDVDLDFDEEEFNKLFVESTSGQAKSTTASKAKEVKKQKIVLIDRKRAQNAGIALARIKFSPEELKSKVLSMNDENLSTDQLRSMTEFLPSREEMDVLRSYKGDIELLGHAEKYMLEMLNFKTAEKRIRCMIYKQQFKPRYLECRGKIAKVQNACDDVKMSTRLRKVLKAVLKVGNQLSDGEEHKGFTVDSLLKLQSAKAFDKKTSVLQYVITLICRTDEDCLRFPEDLKHVGEAARLSMDTIAAEKATLLDEFNGNLRILEEVRDGDNSSNDTNAMLDFFVKAEGYCKELDRGIDRAKEKFLRVLEYFGEDPSMSSQEFFSTLSKFIQEFVSVRDNVQRAMRQQQQQRQQLQAQQQQAQSQSQQKTGSDKHRRFSTFTSREASGLAQSSDVQLHGEGAPPTPMAAPAAQTDVRNESLPAAQPLGALDGAVNEPPRKPLMRRKSSFM